MSGEEARLRQQVSILQRKLENQSRQHEYDEEDRLQEAAAKAREQAATLAQAGAICINPSQPCAYDGAPSRSISSPHADFALSCRRSCPGGGGAVLCCVCLCCAVLHGLRLCVLLRLSRPSPYLSRNAAVRATGAIGLLPLGAPECEDPGRFVRGRAGGGT
jgi:hypothetical protein